MESKSCLPRVARWRLWGGVGGDGRNVSAPPREGLSSPSCGWLIERQEWMVGSRDKNNTNHISHTRCWQLISFYGQSIWFGNNLDFITIYLGLRRVLGSARRWTARNEIFIGNATTLNDIMFPINHLVPNLTQSRPLSFVLFVNNASYILTIT